MQHTETQYNGGQPAPQARTAQLIYGCFDGLRGQEIAMTLEQALSASHQGRCDEDVAALLKVPEIAAQFAKMNPATIREGLYEAGAWEDEELADDHENQLRALWLAAGSIAENYREAKQRLEYLRNELRAECISYGELAELQDLIPFIDEGDLELLEAAGVPERP